MLESEVIKIYMLKNAIIFVKKIYVNKIAEKKRVTRLPNFPDRRIIIGNFFIFRGWGGAGVILFIPRTVLKHKVQLLPTKVCAILYLLKDKVANPHPLKKIFSKYH